jgi:energy-coupling factor transporter ATP-binding protein EcfA2
MSAILTAKGLAAGHADRLLFSGLDLVIAPGEITGLIGANGAGKSTLLRMLAGLVPPDEGEIGLSPPAATVGYLSQEPERRPGESSRSWMRPRRCWSTGSRGRTTPTPPRWSAGSPWAAPTSRSARPRSSPPSACPPAPAGRR